MEGRRRLRNADDWKCLSKQLVLVGVKCFYLYGQAVMGREIIVPKFLMSHCREKLLVRKHRPVPQTDTGSRGENPKVSERTLVKELGKMTP